MAELDLAARARGLRRLVLETVAATGKGHIGGAYSCLDLLVALYHGGQFRHRPSEPQWEGRDRFILSKGHAAVALHAVLADAGYFPVALLARTGKEGCLLGEHPDPRTPGIEVGTGSLGNGLGIGTGLALADCQSGRPNRTVVLLGDGECYEGSVWEAAQYAAHLKLASLVAILDLNGQITMDYTRDCNDFGDMGAKWRAFGWEVLEVEGHAFEALGPVLAEALSGRAGKPTLVLARTVKGKGVSFMEGKLAWHHGVPKPEQLAQAREELSA